MGITYLSAQVVKIPHFSLINHVKNIRTLTIIVNNFTVKTSAIKGDYKQRVY